MAHPGRLRDLGIAAALVVATGLVFGQVWAHDFVNYDDPLYVVANPMVQGGLSARSTAWAFTTFHAGNWHPLTWLSFLVEREGFGLRPGALHLTNLALHSLDTLLLFALLRRLSGAVWRPALVAALFALHPLHVESVAWIAERKDVLSTAWGLLALHAYVSWARRGGVVRYLACFGCLALGLMSKAMLVTWPFVFLLLDYAPLGRLPAHGPVRAWLAVLGLRVVEKLPFFALSIVVSLVTVIAQRGSGALVESLHWAARAANAATAAVWYLAKAIWPSHLVPLYPHSGAQIAVLATLGAFVLLAAVTVVLLGPLRRHRCLTVGWLFYLGTLVPVSGIVQVGAQATADRYTYVPLIGIFVAFAWGLGVAVQRWPRARPAAIAGSAAALLALGAAAHAQTAHWRNSLTLFEHALAVSPGNPVSLVLYGQALEERGRQREALPQYRAAVEIDPDFELALIALGRTLHEQRRSAEAIPWLEAAVARRPDWSSGLVILGRAQLASGDPDAALASFRRALAVAPDSAEAHHGAGRALAHKGRLAEAEEHFASALRIDPGLRAAQRDLERMRAGGSGAPR